MNYLSMDNSQVSNLLPVTGNDFALPFRKELRFLQRIKISTNVHNHKGTFGLLELNALRILNAYTCRNVVSLAKFDVFDVRSCHDFDNPINQTHNFLDNSQQLAKAYTKTL